MLDSHYVLNFLVELKSLCVISWIFRQVHRSETNCGSYRFSSFFPRDCLDDDVSLFILCFRAFSVADQEITHINSSDNVSTDYEDSMQATPKLPSAIKASISEDCK